jgi:hypothetical protein
LRRTGTPSATCGKERRYERCAAPAAGPARPELTCDECFEHLDRYVELELEGRDADAAIPGMAAHLEGCPACGKDHVSLRALLEAEPGAPPS